MCVTSLPQSMSNPVDGSPSMAMRPPWFMLSIIAGSADAAPLISKPMSKPSRMPSARCASRISWRETSTTSSAPIPRAISRRGALTSVPTMKRAPACRATAIAIRPIGPHPVTSTSSPTSGKRRAVCTALPSGSKIAPSSGVTSAWWTHTFVAGSERYSAKAPSRCSPSPIVRMHICRRPARQFRQVPQTMCPSPDTRSPTAMSWTSGPTSTTSP